MEKIGFKNVPRLIVAFIFFFSWAAFSHAESKDIQTKSVKQDTTKKQKRIKLFLDEIEVRGWVEKPQTIFVVPGVNPQVDDIILDRSFSNEIMRPMDKAKFDKLRLRKKKLVIPW